MIVPNSIVQQVRIIRKRHWLTWPTILPFAPLYLLAIYMINFPEDFWGHAEYIVNQTHIDFLHAALIPLVCFFHGFTALFTVWSVRFKVRCLFVEVNVDRFTDAFNNNKRGGDTSSSLDPNNLFAFLETRPHKGESMIVPILRERPPPAPAAGTATSAGALAASAGLSNPSSVSKDGNIHFFNFQQRKWIFDFDKKQFTKPIFPDTLAFSTYRHAAGHETPASAEAFTNAYGLNLLPLHVPEFFELLTDHVFAPFFIFQMFCVLLWCLDEYWMYSMFSGVMMLFMECTVVMQRIRSLKSLRQMGEVPVIPVIVKRGGKWQKIQSNQLLPMDLMIVPTNAHCPADCVLVSGTTVMNEAMLTGESTPQLKEPVDDTESTFLDLRRDGRHILFGGTQILVSSGPTSVLNLNVKASACAVVVKTGFETKQGKLLRTILHSQGRVSENSGEAFGFIGVLVVFALIASGYLLRRGLADPTKDRWKLFLHCTQIITSVVPSELPMELTLAVNASLMALMRLKIFCTEPFRTPFAGKLDTCCFDKTGTITTDEMLFSGVDLADGKGLRHKREDMPRRSEDVLAGCHALVHLENNDIAGDAMEKAAVQALGYQCSKEDSVTRGGSNGTPQTTYNIALRFPFSPVLRRMSTVVTTAGGEEKLIVVKGSPEGIRDLCGHSIPSDYDDVFQSYAAKGLRVIALAYKDVPAEYRSRAAITTIPREEAESGLTFAGFAVFNCPLKKDAQATISNLINGSHRCVIITGDNIQTALAVGKMVGIAPCARHVIARGGNAFEAKSGRFPTKLYDSDSIYRSTDNNSAASSQPVQQSHVHELSTADVRSRSYVPTPVHRRRSGQLEKELKEKFDLCVDADGMSEALFGAVVHDAADRVAVWARCNPTQKELIIARLKTLGHIVLMAGDGTNDVGALKQADVGIAVLNANAVDPAASTTANNNNGAVTAAGGKASEPVDPSLPPMPPGFKLVPIPPPLPPTAGFMDRMKYEVQIAQRKAQIIQLEKLDKVNKERRAKGDAVVAAANGNNNTAVASPAAAAAPAADQSLSSLMESAFNTDFEDDANPMVKLGDASIAAPFTAKSKRLMSVVDVVRMGRNTLVTTMQMYKILALNCLVSAYSMSVLHSDGVKMSDKQMMLTGVILSICFLCMSRCQPTDQLSSQRPVTRVFHPYMVCSIFGQFALHLYSLMTSVQMVTDVQSDALAISREDISSADFRPSLLNTVVFFITTIMTATTFFVNYRGEPFMKNMRQNRPMFYSLIVLVGIVFYFALEIDPEVNEMFEVVKMPTEAFKNELVQLLLTDMIGSYVIEMVCLKTMTDG